MTEQLPESVEQAIVSMQIHIEQGEPDPAKVRNIYLSAYGRYREAVLDVDVEGSGILLNAYIKKEAWRRYAEAHGIAI